MLRGIAARGVLGYKRGMSRFSILALVLILSAGVRAQTTQPVQAAPPTTAPTVGAEAAGRRALIVSIDGLRPDLLIRARTPVLQSLIQEGSFTFWARTTEVSITLPSHVSMLTGVPPEKHGINWNSTANAKVGVYPASPTLFEIAKGRQMTTGMATGKAKFDALAKPGTIDWQFVPMDDLRDDNVVAERAAEIIRTHRPQLMFVHFPTVDSNGHRIGWGTAAQIQAVESADAALGKVIDAIKQTGFYDQTYILISADHGGAGKSHGANDPRSRHIPWIIRGPGVLKNFDLTSFPKLVVNTEDTFATIGTFLGLTLPSDITGKPVVEVLEKQDLMYGP